MENLAYLTNELAKDLIPEAGPRATFLNQLVGWRPIFTMLEAQTPSTSEVRP